MAKANPYRVVRKWMRDNGSKSVSCACEALDLKPYQYYNARSTAKKRAKAAYAARKMQNVVVEMETMTTKKPKMSREERGRLGGKARWAKAAKVGVKTTKKQQQEAALSFFSNGTPMLVVGASSMEDLMQALSFLTGTAHK